MVDRTSALAAHYRPGKTGILDDDGNAGVILEDVKNLVLHQVAAWPESLSAVGDMVSKAAGCKTTPGPCRAESGKSAATLRVEPLKWWIYEAEAPKLDAELGATIDISHSRTHIRITGPSACEFLNRFLPIDLREDSFPVGSVASSVIHHVGITLWRSEKGYEMFIPRGFAESLWQVFVESATQFGLEIV
ncbi:MAG: heterotetrameric sarcosine oxidase gamma subunit [Gammaproteobacteria bacterium]|jgi:heterotetrameric sarcosine oxidase gamma subunit